MIDRRMGIDMCIALPRRLFLVINAAMYVDKLDLLRGFCTRDSAYLICHGG